MPKENFKDLQNAGNLQMTKIAQNHFKRFQESLASWKKNLKKK